ncbi:MAG: peptidoglycan-binding protein [Clostridia bacterium]|nr:peptidoglycan-binding protein [Clostridia bacterium]
MRVVQEKKGLTSTGETDEKTWELLLREAKETERNRLPETGLFPEQIFPIAFGNSGSYVVVLQSVLSEVLSVRLPTDGFFGKRTVEAVKVIQKRFCLPQTGTVSPELWKNLSQDYRNVLIEKIPE